VSHGFHQRTSVQPTVMTPTGTGSASWHQQLDRKPNCDQHASTTTKVVDDNAPAHLRGRGPPSGGWKQIFGGKASEFSTGRKT